MGYDVSYNSIDYAESRSICQQVYSQLQGIEQRLMNSAVKVDQCQSDVNLQCAVAGIGARGYNLGLLADYLRSGYRHAYEAVLAARTLTERVDAAIENYESSEALVEKLMLESGWKQTAESFVDQTINNGNRPPTRNMQDMLRLLMLLNPWNLLRQDMDSEELVTQTTRELTETLAKIGPGYTLQLTEKSPKESIIIDGTLESYAQLHRVLNDGGEPKESQIIVAQVDPNKYMVVIPGTQDGMGGPNPFDTIGIVDAFSKESENLVGPISEALEDSGAGPTDEVILTGYSQGGIHVANLLKSKLMRKKFKITKGLTLGSPIGGISIPKDIKTLSIEDSKDMVPGTDGRQNRTTDEQMTVIFDGPRQEVKDLLPPDGTFGPPHSLKNYSDHLKELEAEPKPEIREQLEAFRLPPGPLQFKRYKIRRVPENRQSEPKGPRAKKRNEQRGTSDLKIAPPH